MLLIFTRDLISSSKTSDCICCEWRGEFSISLFLLHNHGPLFPLQIITDQNTVFSPTILLNHVTLLSPETSYSPAIHLIASFPRNPRDHISSSNTSDCFFPQRPHIHQQYIWLLLSPETPYPPAIHLITSFPRNLISSSNTSDCFFPQRPHILQQYIWLLLSPETSYYPVIPLLVFFPVIFLYVPSKLSYSVCVPSIIKQFHRFVAKYTRNFLKISKAHKCIAFAITSGCW